MTGKVINEGEVYLNGNFYPIIGKVRRQTISRFPAKVDIGDSSYGNELLRSNWIINDQRGGIGVEEMDESIHADRCWWSTCDLDYVGHILPPPLASSVNISAALVTITGNTDVDTKWTNEGNAYDDDLATLATCGCNVINNWNGFLHFNFTSVTVTGIWLKVGRNDANVNSMQVWYYKADTWVLAYTGNPATTYHAVGLSLTGVTSVKVRFYNNGGLTYEGYIYEIRIFTTGTISTLRFCDFNSNLYIGCNRVLSKLDTATGDTFTPIWYMPANITDLISTVGTQMAVLLGDADELWYMSTAEALTETDETGAYWGIHWDGKFFYIDSVGAQMSYCTSLAATLVETNNGSLPEGVTVNGLLIYYDTNGDDIIYAGTKNKFWAHDYANAKFTETKLDFASHPNACKGMINWNGEAYIPMGLHVKKYSVGASAAIVSSVGLDRDDGLPTEYNGEIVGLIKDTEQFYALVDSTQVSTTGNSWVAKYNGRGWQCLWADGTSEEAMHSGIVSDVYSRRLWWDCGNKLYYVAVPRTKILPKKDSAYNYALDGIHLSPWFDAGTKVFGKLALAVKTYCRDVNAYEVAYVKYRVDKSNTSIEAGWTDLVSLETTGDNDDKSTSFASGVGKVFNTIQLRFEMARTTVTNAPDLQSVVLSFMKILDPSWAFTFTVDCAGAGARKSAHQLEDALVTAAETNTLLEFTYRSDEGTAETHYVKINPMGGITPTGKNHDAQYTVTLIEL